MWQQASENIDSLELYTNSNMTAASGWMSPLIREIIQPIETLHFRWAGGSKRPTTFARVFRSRMRTQTFNRIPGTSEVGAGAWKQYRVAMHVGSVMFEDAWHMLEFRACPVRARRGHYIADNDGHAQQSCVRIREKHDQEVPGTHRS
jgi:hypothetical protein